MDSKKRRNNYACLHSASSTADVFETFSQEAVKNAAQNLPKYMPLARAERELPRRLERPSSNGATCCQEKWNHKGDHVQSSRRPRLSSLCSSCWTRGVRFWEICVCPRNRWAHHVSTHRNSTRWHNCSVHSVTVFLTSI